MSEPERKRRGPIAILAESFKADLTRMIVLTILNIVIWLPICLAAAVYVLFAVDGLTGTQ